MIDYENYEEIMLFYVSVEFRGAATVEKFLKNSPWLATAKDEYQCQPIHALGDVEFDEILDLLLKYGADINAQNNDGHSLLHYHDFPINISKIVEAGGNIDLRDKCGRTPLMHQILRHKKEPFYYNKLPMVKVLLYHGANVHLKDNNNKTALDFALEQDDSEFTRNIEKALDNKNLTSLEK